MNNIVQKKKFFLILISVLIVILSTSFILFKLLNNKKSAQMVTSQSQLEENALEKADENIVEKAEKPTKETKKDSNKKIEKGSEESIENLQKNQSTQVGSSSSKSVSSSNKNNKNTYYIKVNYQANVVTIYTKDSKGNYTVPYKAMICSAGTATPKSGVYPIQYRWRWLSLIGGVYGQYSTQIVGDILFHSVPYLSKSQNSLEYWEYDKLGTFASAGCIRLTVRDALWIYNNIPSGTNVEFYASSNPGPLRKTICSENFK